MDNDKNKNRLIKLLLEQWKTDKCAARLVDRSIYYVIEDTVYRLTCEDGMTVSTYPQAALFSSQESSYQNCSPLHQYQHFIA